MVTVASVGSSIPRWKVAGLLLLSASGIHKTTRTTTTDAATVVLRMILMWLTTNRTNNPQWLGGQYSSEILANTRMTNATDRCVRPMTSAQTSLLATTLLLLVLLQYVSSVRTFQCYVCDSKNDIECTEKLPDNSRLTPKDCSNITGAKYCIKTTNLFAGKQTNDRKRAFQRQSFLFR